MLHHALTNVGPPSPEVTESSCRVPSRAFVHQPECTCTSPPETDPYDICARTLSCMRVLSARRDTPTVIHRVPIARVPSQPHLGIESPTVQFGVRRTLGLAAARNCPVLYVTHACIVTSDSVPRISQPVSSYLQNSLLLHAVGSVDHTAWGSIRYTASISVHLRRTRRRSVSCYALLKRWLLPSLRSDGPSTRTSFVILSGGLETLLAPLGCFPLVLGP